MKKSFKQYIAGIFTASVVGGLCIGVGAGFTQNLISSNNSTATTLQEDFKFQNINNNPVELTQVKYIPTISTSQISSSVGPSIVYIESTIVTTDYFNRSYEQTGSGSGIIYKETDDKYYIATNNHVIEDANKILVTLESGQIVEAKLTGSASQTDLAVIEIEKSVLTSETLSSIAVAVFGNSDELQVGETAIAIGNPLGAQFDNSVTQGIISALNRQIQVDDKNLTVIQTDAAINPGNSGGALVNSNAEVIGINSVKIATTGVEGMGFAIPSNTAVPILEDLIANGSIKTAFLGIKGMDVTEDLAGIFGLPVGVYVGEVIEGGPAEKAGLQAEDIILEFNGEKILSMEQLSETIKNSKVGETIILKVVRNSKAVTLNVTLEATE